jgi:hypothetical protein
VLADPPLAEAAARLDANRRATLAWDHDFQGRRAGRLRAMARRQAFEAAKAWHERMGLDPPGAPAPDAPLVVTGHQPELFHPGVWVKNFAAAHVAREAGGSALNLVVDNDIPKWASVRVPSLDPDGTLRAVAVDFDDWTREVPFEDWTLDDPALFASFPDRVRAALGGQVPDPVLDEFWPGVVAAGDRTDRIGHRFAAARRRLEARWGVRNAEVPLSALCETEAFGWFASHLLAHLPRFQRVHNDALRRYRKTYGIRSKNHPVPALTGEGDWLEAPFWVWRERNPRRRPLLARQEGQAIRLRIAGDPDPIATLPLAPDREACCAVEALGELAARGVRVRTRALTTTMFARLVVGDLFLHGIGGAKYDELGDEVVRGFFGIEPPSYLTLSQTIWLGLPEDPASAESLRVVERDLRDLEFNPDRHLDGHLADELRGLVAAKRAAIAGPQDTRRQRARRYFEIRRLNEALSPAVGPRREALSARRDALRAGLRRNLVARSREYAFILHSAGRLRRRFEGVAPLAFGPPAPIPEEVPRG